MFQAHLAHLLTLPFLQGAPVPFVKEWCLEAKMRTKRDVDDTGTDTDTVTDTDINTHTYIFTPD